MIAVARRPRTARALVALTVTAAALIGCGSALATATPRPSPSYLFSIPTAAGSLTGPDDRHLTLRLAGTRSYLTRFTDRPLRQAFVVANVDFDRRFTKYFAGSDPNAVLTYTRAGSRIPVSVVLTIGHPRWNARQHTWTFSATRIRTQPDNLPDTTVHVVPSSIPNPRAFTQATLLIDNANPCAKGPYTYLQNCVQADFYEEDLTGVNLSNLNLALGIFSYAKLTGASLVGSHLESALLDYADFTSANLAAASLENADASYSNFTNANLSGSDLYGTDFWRANLTGAYLAGARGADLTGATLCNTTLPTGERTGC